MTYGIHGIFAFRRKFFFHILNLSEKKHKDKKQQHREDKDKF